MAPEEDTYEPEGRVRVRGVPSYSGATVTLGILLRTSTSTVLFIVSLYVSDLPNVTISTVRVLQLQLLYAVQLLVALLIIILNTNENLGLLGPKEDARD